MNLRRFQRLVVALCTVFAIAASRATLIEAAQKTVHVKGYTKKDGTVVKPYDRKAPGSPATTYSTPPPSTASTQAQQVPPNSDVPSLSTVFVVGGPAATALYHRALCPWLKVNGAVLSTYTVAEAEKRYFQPHCLCIAGHDGVPPCPAINTTSPATAAPLIAEMPPAPNRVDPKPASAASPQSAAATETVYVTKTGGKYHRAGCRFLSTSAIPMALKDATNRYSPCSVCKPPVLAK